MGTLRRYGLPKLLVLRACPMGLGDWIAAGRDLANELYRIAAGRDLANKLYRIAAGRDLANTLHRIAAGRDLANTLHRCIGADAP